MSEYSGTCVAPMPLAEESYKGYAGNVVETMDEKGSSFTRFGYKQCIYMDSALCNEKNR